MIYNTEARNRILEFLLSSPKDSYTAEEIFAAVSPYGIGRSTVFRQLAKLSSTAEIKRTSDEHSRSVKYQVLNCKGEHEHLHLKCKSCGKLIHLDSEISHLFEEKLRESEGFSLDSAAFLFGICDGCNLGEDGK